MNVEGVLELVLSKLRANGIKTGAMRLLHGPYLGQYRIMEAAFGWCRENQRLHFERFGAVSP